jgi:tRNA(Ser,Leu) C12 N-acetylase TAN1
MTNKKADFFIVLIVEMAAVKNVAANKNVATNMDHPDQTAWIKSIQSCSSLFRG